MSDSPTNTFQHRARALTITATVLAAANAAQLWRAMMKTYATTLVATLMLAHAAPAEDAVAPQSHPYVGMWATEDGRVRHELLPSGRYVEARGNRERAYEGRYEITGNYIEYWDDTGFTADGKFVDGILYHAGMVLSRR